MLHQANDQCSEQKEELVSFVVWNLFDGFHSPNVFGNRFKRSHSRFVHDGNALQAFQDP